MTSQLPRWHRTDIDGIVRGIVLRRVAKTLSAQGTVHTTKAAGRQNKQRRKADSKVAEAAALEVVQRPTAGAQFIRSAEVRIAPTENVGDVTVLVTVAGVKRIPRRGRPAELSLVRCRKVCGLRGPRRLCRLRCRSVLGIRPVGLLRLR